VRKILFFTSASKDRKALGGRKSWTRETGDSVFTFGTAHTDIMLEAFVFKKI